LLHCIPGRGRYIEIETVTGCGGDWEVRNVVVRKDVGVFNEFT
jgi:hypothetical protein